jgi:hypothetical protein
LRGTWIVGATLLAGLPLCVSTLASETRISLLDRAERRFLVDGDKTSLRRALHEDEGCGETCPPRRLLLRAIGYGRLAAGENDPAARRADLDIALDLNGQALADRPEWGDALALRAQIDTLDPARTGDAIGAFRASYRANPYIREASLWRLRFGTAHWAMLDPATRDAIVEEAAWLAGITTGDRQAAQQALGDSPAGLRLALRLSRPPLSPTI